jgi:hypothetical protein
MLNIGNTISLSLLRVDYGLEATGSLPIKI